MGEFGHARAADRTEPRIDHAVRIRLDHQMHVLAVLPDDVVHGRAEPGGGLGRLLFGQVHAEGVLPGGGRLAALAR
jgi:hypothetical protein